MPGDAVLASVQPWVASRRTRFARGWVLERRGLMRQRLRASVAAWGAGSFPEAEDAAWNAPVSSSLLVDVGLFVVRPPVARPMPP